MTIAPGAAPVPDVSIVIVSWNTRALVLDCLRTLAAAAGGCSREVVVVDNASADGSVEAVTAAHPDVRIVANAVNRGFAAANNQGIALATGRYVLLLNSDTRAEPGSIEALVRFADAHPRAGVLGAMLIDPDGSFQASFMPWPGLANELVSALGIGRRLVFRNYPSRGPSRSRHPRPVAVIPGACLLVRRAALDTVGPLDEAYFMYSEETDLCRRMADAGWERWYVPGARIVHLGGQSTRQQRDDMVRALYRSKVRYFARHRGRLAAAALRGSLVVVLAARRLWTAGRAPAIGWRDLEPAP